MTPAQIARKRRYRLKARAAAAERETVSLAEIFALGGVCGNCQHRGKGSREFGPICDLKSDFHGDVRVKLTDVCVQWKPAA